MASPVPEVESRGFEADELCWPEFDEVQRAMARFGFLEPSDLHGERRKDAAGAQLEQIIPTGGGGGMVQEARGFLPKPFSPPGSRSLVDAWRFQGDQITGRDNYLLGSVLNSNTGDGSILAGITADNKTFSNLCVERTDEVVTMIRSCRSWNSFKLLRKAIEPWMAPLILDPNRLRVVQVFLQSVPPDFAMFIFDAVAKNCFALACCQKGVCLLQSCLEHFKGAEKDTILYQISCRSIYLAQNHYGNYIVQDVLKQGDPSYLAVIASCFRNNYVELSRQRYSSNVMETCLEVFDDVERFVIVEELIWYPHFRDLVIDPFANYVIYKALMTCKVLLRNRLAIAILCVKNINRRSPHCLRIFNKLSDLGYMHRKEDQFQS